MAGAVILDGQSVSGAALEIRAARAATGLREFLKPRLARYKVPKLIEFRTGLPREDTGKIFKRKLREPYWRDAGRQI